MSSFHTCRKDVQPSTKAFADFIRYGLSVAPLQRMCGIVYDRSHKPIVNWPPAPRMHLSAFGDEWSGLNALDNVEGFAFIWKCITVINIRNSE